MKIKLDKIFSPTSIAVIGASNREHSVGRAVFQNILSGGFEGVVYPVNPKHNSIQGVKCYDSIKDVPERVDLAIILTPTKTVVKIAEECGKDGVGGLLVISSGFQEMGKEGQKLSQKLLEVSHKYGMRFLGPNCLGFINPALKINASFAHRNATPGKLAFISQSGALCTVILDWAAEKNVGFSHFVSGGSMTDIGFHDLIDYFGSDRNTSAILIYMESLTDARKFLSAARAFARTKPIIVLKAGKSQEGARSALSHTGSLAGNDRIFESAFRRAGIVRVDTIEQLFDVAQAIAMQSIPDQNRLAIVTNAGGPGVLATDYLIEHGGKLANFEKNTIEKLNLILSSNWSHGNPVDALGDSSAKQYGEAVSAVLADKGVDGVLAIFVPQAITSATETAENLVKIAKNTHKTVLAAWMGEVQEARDILEEGKVPVYKFPESGVYSFLKMHSYGQNIKTLYETPPNIPMNFNPKIEETRALLNSVMAEKRFVLTEQEAKTLLGYYEIPVTHPGIAANKEDLNKIAKEIPFPWAMKIMSPDITHKTDIGGVKLHIENMEVAQKAFDTILENAKKAKPKAEIVGILVEPMVEKRYELLIGTKKDPMFGPVILFGMGGVATEIYKDNKIGLPPLNMALAMRLIERTKIYELLKGFRNLPSVDMGAIQFLLYKVAYLVMEFPQIQEIDLNPFMVDEKGGMVVDANIILDKKMAGKTIKPYSHLAISPYPFNLTKKVKVKDGKQVTLRPIKPEDEPEILELFKSLSRQSIYFRFFSYVPKVTHDMLTRFTQIDYDREMAIVAEIQEEGKKKLSAVVRIVQDTLDNQAEFAIVVGDPWQGTGLGNMMMDYILDIAKKMELKKVYANVLKSNKAMVHMFKKRGFKLVSQDFDTLFAEMELA
ncbi:MAG: bifunctional acetate--CoA ligase family protein/GNAT family N-acetyltransferase [Saprospiraceae bacterium]|nr:bifunctional acetate--CoA ligase family protein/GNAT family N-acetyltransferase [Saprospiraceae bacterium]